MQTAVVAEIAEIAVYVDLVDFVAAVVDFVVDVAAAGTDAFEEVVPVRATVAAAGAVD